MKKAFLFLIFLYQKYVSPVMRPKCKFFPTCSEYAKEAIEKYGAWKGARLSASRILRCHPWQENKIDKVP